jgi:hypothetical protein
MPASILTTRLPDWLGEELRDEFARNGEGPSEGLRRIVEEWWVLKNLPAIEYRDSLDGPRPAIMEGPELWEFIMVQKSYGTGLDGISEYFGGLAKGRMEQALAYYKLFPESIDEHLRENQRLERLMLEDQI